MKKNIEPYYVLLWDTNKDNIEYYNIMPYLIDCYKKIKKSKRFVTPITYEEIKKFILDESQYRYWARCQYEIIVSGWPIQKNKAKLDVFNQIELNIDIITKHFISQL